MNFLGHFYLSQGNEDYVVGNFIADFVKGKKYLDYPEGIAEGIKMHREIDYFTDNHSLVRAGRKRLFPKYRHYSGVIIDMYYDHYLANLWDEYSMQSLNSFAGGIYAIIEKNWQILPVKSQYMFPYMKEGNWLLRYQSTEGIGRSLTGMAHRLNNGSKLDQAVVQLHEFYSEFRHEFQSFIVDIKNQFVN